MSVTAEQLRGNLLTMGFVKPLYKQPLYTSVMPKAVLTYCPSWKSFIFLPLHFEVKILHEEGNAFPYLKKDL